jgi:hypothetical protein
MKKVHMLILGGSNARLKLKIKPLKVQLMKKYKKQEGKTLFFKKLMFKKKTIIHLKTSAMN